jgi:hypothetical protein
MSAPLSVSLSVGEVSAQDALARLMGCSRSEAVRVSMRAGLAAVLDGRALLSPSELSAGAVSVSVVLPLELGADVARVASSRGVSMSEAARALFLASEPAPASVAPLPFEGSIFRPSWARG